MNLATLKSKLQKVEVVPAGWKTSPQWGTEWKLSSAQTLRLLTQALENKLARRKSFRVQTGSGARMMPHYKFKEVA